MSEVEGRTGDSLVLGAPPLGPRRAPPGAPPSAMLRSYDIGRGFPDVGKWIYSKPFVRRPCIAHARDPAGAPATQVVARPSRSEATLRPRACVRGTQRDLLAGWPPRGTRRRAGLLIIHP